MPRRWCADSTTDRRYCNAQPHSALRRNERVAYQTDQAIIAAVSGTPVTKLTPTKASIDDVLDVANRVALRKTSSRPMRAR